MPSLNDYIVFVDERGDHELVSINPSYPMFVLAFCLFDKHPMLKRLRRVPFDSSSNSSAMTR
jgi:hypothetical protein